MKFSAHLGVSQWVQLPDYVRQKIVILFDIPRSEGALVQDGKLKSDGHSEKDLQTVSIEKMQDFLHSKSTNYFELFDGVLEYVENTRLGEAEASVQERAERAEVAQRAAVQSATETIAAIGEAVRPLIKRRGRPAKTK